MSTYGSLQDRINNDYLNRTDFTAETRRAIRAGIRHYERQRWWFNETATSLVTSAGQTFVNLPANYFDLDLLQLTTNSNDIELIRRDYNWIKKANTARTRGLPTDFTIYQNRIELFPVPDAIYTLPISYKHKFPALSGVTSDSTSSHWTSAVEDLIVYHATAVMWVGVLRDTERAMAFRALEQTALTAILGENEQHFNIGITPTRF